MTGWLACHHPPEIPRSPLGLEEVAAQPLVYHGPFGSMIVCSEGGSTVSTVPDGD